MEFLVLPPEVNSALMYAGAGAGPLVLAATAWQGLAADLHASASSFDSVVTALATGPWSGAAATAMAAAAATYVSWLSSAAAQAAGTAGQAQAAATAFETAQTATVHPAAVTANRLSLMSLVATNFIGQNTPAIAATEFDYAEMWAQDVAAMLGYHAGAASVASALTPFALPPIDLPGLAATVGTLADALTPLTQAATAAAQSLLSGSSLQSLQSLTSVAQVAATPVSMLMSPMMSLAQGANGAGVAGTGLTGLADAPKMVGDTAPALKGGMGLGAAADLGKARLVGAVSVPPSWPGSMPKGVASSVVSGLAALSGVGETSQAAAAGGMPMMPMPMGSGGIGGPGAGMPGGMLGRGGANPHVVQQRPSVIPRTGVG
ncbi:PPE family protein [Mycobacterium angelicum]|uniref:PPE family protein n=1 Tax=Mycobacterium angelicum TaxID=470074 RepID=A0A1W9ZKL5_MYCAN|nr:PPE family protein [Mycobacterium angelicum]MCV7196174.1 PPE family protein [Mycobacterium angelicum]ORA17248.1 hypothetical protein BST12_19855 [Mycobacterium angelicum]